jgi:hypothetical protein
VYGNLANHETLHILLVNTTCYISYLYTLAMVWASTKNFWSQDQRRLVNTTLAILVGLPPLPMFLTKAWTLFALQNSHTAVIITIVTLLNILTTVAYFSGIKRINNVAYHGIPKSPIYRPTTTQRRRTLPNIWTFLLGLTCTLLIIQLV